MLKDILRLLVALSFLAPVSAFGRQSAPQAWDAAATAELISRAAARVAEYKERFKDLIAEETQRIEEYGAEGLKRRREVVSDLIIYQSQIDSSAVVEYRNVRMVDGKEVSRRDRRVEQLFGRLAKADSRKKELERIAKESKRYDLNYSAYNHTLDQGIPLTETLRPVFRFTVTGGDRIDGHDVIVVGYEQVSQTTDLNFKFSSLPKRLQGAEVFHRGRLWLDRDTARLRREERELTLRHASLPTPLTLMKFEFYYADSPFEILTPTRIIFSAYDRGRDLPGGGAEMSLGGRVVFEYGKFSRFGVDAPDSRLDPPGTR